MQLILDCKDLLPKHQKCPGMNNASRKCPIRFLSVEKFKPDVIDAINLLGGAVYEEGGKSKCIYPKGREPSLF